MNLSAQHHKHAASDIAQSATADKIKGKTKQTMGIVKERLDRKIGYRELEAKGSLQREVGKKDQFKGEIKEQILDVKDRVKAGVHIATTFFDARR